jgi:hypothetical protein
MTDHVPPAISAAAENFARDIPDTQVAVEQKAATRWRITVSSARVTMWVEYEPRSRGRLLMKNSKLFVDGAPAPRAGNYARLVQIFRNPDGDGSEELTTAEAYASAQEADLADAPAEVGKVYRIMAGRAQGSLALVLRRHGWRWFVCLNSSRVQLAVMLGERLMDHTRPLREPGAGMADGDSVYLAIDGVDHSEQVQNNLERALKMAAAHEGAPARPAIDRESAAEVNTSVQVRRSTVIRT